MSVDELHEVVPGIIQLKIPLPFSLKWVNSYLIMENNSFKIIDPGLRTEESIEKWNDILLALNVTWKQCSAILLTHHHPDHYGLAGYVQELSGAPVYMTEEAYRYTQSMWGSGKLQYEEGMVHLLQQHGTPNEIQKAILEHLREFEGRVQPKPIVTFYDPHEDVKLAGMNWTLIPTMGHAYGGIMLYEKEHKLMIVGDQVLPKITPHVGVIPGEDRPVLSEFLHNLQEIAQYDVSLALPGHRDPFSNFSERALQIVAHHERRLAKLKDYIQDVREINAFQCCEWLFGTHLRNNAHNMRFALTETIAHLEELVRRNILQRVERNEVILYKV